MTIPATPGGERTQGRHRDAPRRRQHGLVAISGALACSGGGGVVLLACAPCSTYTRGDVVGLLTIIRLKCWCWGFTLLAVTQEDCGAEMTELIRSHHLDAPGALY